MAKRYKYKWYNKPPFVYWKYWLLGFKVAYRAALKYWDLSLSGKMVRQDIELK